VKRVRTAGRLVVLLAAALLAGRCASPHGAPSSSGSAGPQPVSLPDLSKLVPTVQTQIRNQHEALTRTLENRGASVVDRADAFGELGKLLMAAQLSDSTETCFLNAQSLNPGNYRWPYYLAQYYRTQGDVQKATTLFERVLQLKPDDVDALVWLGEMRLSAGNPDAAQAVFAKALELSPSSVSARFGLGRTALAKGDNRKAVDYLEEVLKLNPKATAAHYPLSLAYSALGDAAKSAEHLRLRRDGNIRPADPLMRELDSLLISPQTYETRGIRALDDEDWSGAAAEFRKGLELSPDSAALHHRLATALSMMNDTKGAQAEFETAVRISADYFPAQFSLGVMLQAEGRHQEAIEHFAAALKERPTYAEARLRMASSLRRTGHSKEAVDEYQQVLASNADLPEARMGYAMMLVKLHRDREARDTLAEAAKAPGDQTVFVHALARLLASSPDDRVRDGRRSMELVQQLLQRGRTPELGETYAMTLAELGRYSEAASVQRDLMRGAERAGVANAEPRLAARLQLYERAEPCRTPWTDEEMP